MCVWCPGTTLGNAGSSPALRIARWRMSIDRNPSQPTGYDESEHAHTSEGLLVEAQSEDYTPARAVDVDPLWYKKVVFDEVLVRAFYECSDDGYVNDTGTTEKLDYLAW